MPAPDPDFAARKILTRNRAIATGLLLIMLALIFVSYALPHTLSTALLQASSKAGFVGGIADWFAITALFRHPLGLPIPHTAIIPREKQRLGDALGGFVARHVATEAEIGRVIDQIDVPGLLRAILTDDIIINSLTEAMARALPRFLSSIEDGRARRLASRLITRILGGQTGAKMLVRVLKNVTEDGRHQEILDFILENLRAAMLSREADLKEIIEARVREQGGRIIGWTLGATIAKRILAAANAEMDRMDPHHSALREAFDEWVRHEIVRLESDPLRAAELGRAIRGALSADAVQGFVWDSWSRLRRALEDDTAKPHGRSRAAMQAMLRDLGTTISEDPAMTAMIKSSTTKMVRSVLPTIQTKLAKFIGEVVGNWDTATITERLELRIGSDLQYIRMNGTLVGFLAGGVLSLALNVVYGHTEF